MGYGEYGVHGVWEREAVQERGRERARERERDSASQLCWRRVIKKRGDRLGPFLFGSPDTLLREDRYGAPGATSLRSLLARIARGQTNVLRHFGELI
jgi:hypothetical protein